MKKLLPFLFCLVFSSAFAGGDPQPAGGRVWGMGSTGVTLRDQFAIFNNVAGLAGAKSPYVFTSYDRRFNFSAFQTFSVGGVLPLYFGKKDFGTTALGIQRFGSEAYSETQISLAYAHKIDLIHLGIKVNMLQVSMGEFGARRRVTFEFGGIADLIPDKLTFGAYIYNFSQAKLADYQDERVPVVMRGGLSWKPAQALMLNLETEKDIDFPAIVKAGVEYEIIKNLKLRTGISSKPYISYFGLGFSPKQLQFDYALRVHPQLGLLHHISFAYRLPDLNKKKAGTAPAP
jgi:hypothetical protein